MGRKFDRAPHPRLHGGSYPNHGEDIDMAADGDTKTGPKTEAETGGAGGAIEAGVGAAIEASAATTDRRAKRRAKTDLFVNRFLNGHPYLCRMTDISLSGARLVAIHEPRLSPPPRFMGLQFKLPGRPEVMTAAGETVTQQGGGSGASGREVGVRFTRLSANATAAIEALLASTPPPA
jgi:hypothetical protein